MKRSTILRAGARAGGGMLHPAATPSSAAATPERQRPPHRRPARPPPAPSEATAGKRHRRDRDGGRLLQHPDRCHRGRPRRDPPGEGPFTVFAPTDEAFAALPEGTLDSLLADPEALKQVLLYHVVSGEVTADQVVGLTSADSVEGSRSRSRSGWLRLPQRHRRGRDD